MNMLHVSDDASVCVNGAAESVHFTELKVKT